MAGTDEIKATIAMLSRPTIPNIGVFPSHAGTADHGAVNNNPEQNNSVLA
jgi:hypothetical protein